MTIDELERDLARLAEPRETDEHLRLAVRATLAKQLNPQPKRRFSRRIALALVAAAAASAGLIALLAGTTGSGPTPADAAILHHTLRAVTPPSNTILHVKVVGVQNGAEISGETWQQTAPPYASRGMKGPIGSQSEAGDNGTTSFLYDSSTNTIYEQPDSSAPTFEDPIASVRKALNDGAAHVEGTVVIGGESLYKIELPQGMVGYFDRATYVPRYLDDPQGDGSVLRLRVAAYEYLPMTSGNAKLLSVTAEHPNARIDTNPADAPGGK